MEAFALQQSNGKALLERIELDPPAAGDREVVIEVVAAGVTPTELLWYPTMHQKDGSPRLGAVPGHEFSGVVIAVGSNVSKFKVGDEIFGMNDWFTQGATAERCAAPEKSIAPKPTSMSHSVAAATPISALTAWQGLVDRASVQAGERVLIVGASGTVGLMAVQIAKMRGCHVIASASSKHAAVLASLGCKEIIDYRSARFEEHLKGIDVVFDAVGADTLVRAQKILKPGGRMVTIAADVEGSGDALVKEAFFIVESSGEQLKHIAELTTLQTFVKAVLPFKSAPEAYMDRSTNDALGKLVLDIRGDIG